MPHFSSITKNMESQIEKYPDGNEDYWVLFWLKQALKISKTSLARGHLSAYLEEVCYWITVKDIKDILKIYNLNQADGFLMVRAIAAEPQFLKKYNFNKGIKIKTYARSYLYWEIVETIRSGNEEEKLSDTGKLRYLSKKEFTERLDLAYIKDPKFSEFLLARQCFHEIYTATTPKGCKNLPWPPEDKLVEISDCYNQRRNPETQAINSQDLRQMLKECQQIIRDYSPIKRLYQLSHGDSIEGLEEQYEWKEMQTDFDDLEDSSFSADKLSEVNSLLLKTFDKLKSEDRKILQLSMGLKMTQADIAKLFEISKQYQVSRKINSSKAILLKALAQWSVKTLNIQLSSEQLNGISPQLKEWLEKHCMAAFNECLKTNLVQSFSSDIPILISLYFKPRDGKGLKTQIVAEKHKISESELEQKIEQIKQQLQEQLIVHLTKRLKVSLVAALVNLLEQTQDEDTRWTAAESLWTIEPNHPDGAIRKFRNLKSELQNQPVALMLAVLPKPDEQLAILLRVYPMESLTFVPPQLQLIVLDQTHQPFLPSIAGNNDSYVQFKFNGIRGEQFTVQVILGNDVFIERFMI